jgi:hypothetical protein
MDWDWPPLTPRSAQALLPAVVERLQKMDLSAEKARLVFSILVERFSVLQSELPTESKMDDSWKQWFDFCGSSSIPASTSRSYLEILEDEDRR